MNRRTNMKELRQLKYRLALLGDVFDLVDNEKPLAIDFETDGLYGTIEMVQFYQAHWDEAILVVRPHLLTLSSLLHTNHIVAHNLSYEISTFQCQADKVIAKLVTSGLTISRIDDTLLASKLQFYTKEKFSLDQCYIHAFTQDIYSKEGLSKKDNQKADWTNPTEDMLRYAAIDVFYLLDLYDATEEARNSESYKLTLEATLEAFKFQLNGLPLNVEKAVAQHTANYAKLVANLLPINVNSWQQVRKYIDEDESDALALIKYGLAGNDKAAEVLKARKLLKQNSFINKFIDEAKEDRIYGKFTFTTLSGRSNCKAQNLQQIPRTLKTLFEPKAGRVFVISDFSQLELRYACAVSGDSRMYEAFMQDLDLHQYTADLMGVPRQQAKTCNFNLLYGGSANMLQTIFYKEGVEVDIAKVRMLKQSWHSTYPTLTLWQNKIIEGWRHGATNSTVLGHKFKAKLYTDALNLPIQGGAADIAKLAMCRMLREIKNAELCNFVHDSYIFEMDNNANDYMTVCKQVAEAMQSAWFDLVKYTKFPDLKMPVDVMVGKSWGDLDYGLETPIYEYNLKGDKND